MRQELDGQPASLDGMMDVLVKDVDEEVCALSLTRWKDSFVYCFV